MRALVKMKAGEQAGLRKLDVCNAFQEFDRSDVMRLIAAKEGDAAVPKGGAPGAPSATLTVIAPSAARDTC